MNRLNSAKRAQIISALVEGNSLCATSRMTGASKVTILRLLESLGPACVEYQDKALRNFTCKRIQCDEIWQFCYAKDKNVPEDKRGTFGYGDVWTWVAIDPDSKFVVSFPLGTRGARTPKRFMDDLASRLANRVQLTTDGHRAYLQAVEDAFGSAIDYAMLVKLYGNDRETEARYSPAECIGCREIGVTGCPDPKHISTSHIERQNLTMRMPMRRFARLTNGFSKKIGNHFWAIALHYMHYNFCRIHQTLRVNPAMEAGIADHVWSIEEIVSLLDRSASIAAQRNKPRFVVGVVGTGLCSETSTGVCSMQFYYLNLEDMTITETQFEKLKDRVKALEVKPNPIATIHNTSTLVILGGVALPTIEILVAVFFGVIPHMENYSKLQIEHQVNDSLKQPLQQVLEMGQDITGIKAKLDAWSPLIIQQIFKKNIGLSEKDFEKSLSELKSAVQLGSQGRVPIPIENITEAAKRTIKLSMGNSNSAKLAWETTSEILRYRSVLNGLSPSKEIELAKPLENITTQYHWRGEPKTDFSITNIPVPANQAAAMDFIGKDENSSIPVGPAMLIGKGGALELDEMHLKNVILVNVHIVYKGESPVILQNVYFIDCTFAITNGSKGIQLASDIISSKDSSITLSVS